MKEAGDEGMGKAISASVFANINNMLEKKSLAQLGALESQINTKLRSGGAIDVEYWETLLECLGVWKSKARIREMYTFMLEKRGRGGDGPTVSSMLGEKKDRVQISAGVYMDKCDVVKDVSCYDPSMSPRLTRDIVSDERTGKLDCVEEMEDYSDLLELRRYVVKMRRERESGSGNVLGPEGGIVVKKEVKKRSEKEKHSGPRFGEVEEAVANDAGLEAMIQEAKRGLDGDDEVFGEGEESALTENVSIEVLIACRRTCGRINSRAENPDTSTLSRRDSNGTSTIPRITTQTIHRLNKSKDINSTYFTRT